jgi:hypothetical protein
MKKLNLTIICALIILSYGCNSGTKNKQSQNDTLSANNAIQSSQCYVAIDGSDTAYLNLQSLVNGKVTGKMLINYSGKPNNNGTLAGQFKGDTLFADYTFTIGENKTINKNPLAFLRDGSRMTLGVGVIETYLGRSYFAKGEPINFERGRFKFDSLECKDQKFK